MEASELVLNSTNDHIMANIWRLIFERRARYTADPLLMSDLSVLEQLLPEYRLIGLLLADSKGRARPN